MHWFIKYPFGSHAAGWVVVAVFGVLITTALHVGTRRFIFWLLTRKIGEQTFSAWHRSMLRFERVTARSANQHRVGEDILRQDRWESTSIPNFFTRGLRELTDVAVLRENCQKIRDGTSIMWLADAPSSRTRYTVGRCASYLTVGLFL